MHPVFHVSLLKEVRDGAVASTALPLTELKSNGTIKAAPVSILAKRLWEGIAYQWRRIWCRGRIFVRKSPLGKISSSYNLKFLLEERVVLRGRQCYFSFGSNYLVSSCHDSTDCRRPIIKAITFVVSFSPVFLDLSSKQLKAIKILPIIISFEDNCIKHIVK